MSLDAERSADPERYVYSATTRCRCGGGLCYDAQELREIRRAFEEAGRREDVVRDSDGRVLSSCSRPNMSDEQLERLRTRDAVFRAWWCEKVLRDNVDLADTTPEERRAGAPPGWVDGMAGGVKDGAGQVHDVYPFWCYELKSEQQPSARGASTRPESDRRAGGASCST